MRNKSIRSIKSVDQFEGGEDFEGGEYFEGGNKTNTITMDNDNDENFMTCDPALDMEKKEESRPSKNFG